MIKYKPEEYPENCPRCGKGLYEKEQKHVKDELIISVYCFDCDFEWTELYKFQNWKLKDGN